ncbi:PREDICTED: DEP domain-containing protein 5 isoform X6 [Papilio polytes]|uniref:DEP domain-containing protein 5 isoform X6 n=1 Tax=Papilio polytes TaxID=76194 RepID=UPI00067631E9|nr:PREDICTED: DEP domain-containing protein 5 isoform X6 [Papilio polytes]
MKFFKLIVHQSSFSPEDLIINLKDYPGLKEKDIVEIYHPENDYPRLLLQVPKVEAPSRAVKDTISVEQSIATTFQLRTFADVYVNIVNVADVALDSVEVTFKDQYMGRSEMWRLKNHLVSTCVYLNKKIEYCGGAIRCQVYEMWSQGDRVACGVITEDTKIVFRSSTSMVYLFIQMSSEMWDFDIHGDLYFEKAVNGFLADLFAKWKKNGSNHEVTIVLFSRTFYKAKSLEEFPQHMKECLQKDYRGRYYEDFYRVAVQNERYDDWSNVLLQLRRLFTDYQKIVLQYHERANMEIPTAINSTAAQGNFLEVLNMSLNVFEKHYLDRCFDRTGQLSVVITPGVGVFEVDRELTNVTKQRIIDNGVGSDLVCVGEQPLHAVPLLKFHNKDSGVNSIDDYSMPHWINLSFYSTNKKVAYSNFIPRIKLPPRMSQEPLKKMYEDEVKGKLVKEDEYMHNSIFDYDAYDAQIFQLPPAHSTCVQRVHTRTKKTSVAGLDINSRKSPPTSVIHHRKMSDPDIHHSLGDMLTGGNKYGGLESTSDTTDSPSSINRLSPRSSISSNKPVIRTGRALINPFDPSHVKVKLTSNRRRWTHIFPKGPKGVLIQQHHYQARPAGEPASRNDDDCCENGTKDNGPSILNNHPVYQVDGNIMSSRKRMISASGALGVLGASVLSASGTGIGAGVLGAGGTGISTTPSTTNNASLALLWGATGEQEWTPALTTANQEIGVDWKSLTIPACLPITTDYFPDKRSLQNDYLVSDYNLLPDDVNADFAQNRAIYKKPLTTNEVFKELVSQRLAQGFQLIVGVNENDVIESHCPSTPAPPPSKVAPQCGKPASAHTKRYLLSIGRIFHKLTLVGSTITVTRYRPRHPYPPFNIHYRYRFHAPYHDTYEVSWVSFTTEKLENYSWNYMDHYICTRGDTDFALEEVTSLKYWRFRTLLLPLSNAATKQILEDESAHCDIYPAPSAHDLEQLTDGFLKMTELYFNKVKRPIKQRMALPAGAAEAAPTRRRHSTSILTRNAQQVSPTKSLNASQCNKAAAKTVLERTQSQTGETEDTYDDGVIEPKLKSNSSLSEIIERMRHPTLGVGFLQQTVSLPSHAFVSIYAIHWLQANMEAVTYDKATTIMERMLQEKMICHASGDTTKRFVVGYYMYHILPQKKEKELSDYVKPLGDLQSFENEWMEVEVLGPRSPLAGAGAGARDIAGAGARDIVGAGTRDVTGLPAFLAPNIDPRYMSRAADTDLPLYKNTHLDIDVSNKSDRIEWGHARYQATFRPDQAYEMCIQWAVASGNIVAELILGWARKAQNCRLQMVPIPADPLALPFTLKSDPLRGPIYVPLNEEPLLRGKSALFEGFPEETWEERLFLFQEAIACRFGFTKCVESTVHQGVGDQLYVHLTGNMFLLIPTAPAPHGRALRKPPNRLLNANRYPVHTDVAASPHKGYISWHVSDKNKDEFDNSRRFQMGFLWSWNHMISKKWKWLQPATGDETFQMRMLRDFKHFCANHEQRLTQFWDHCWDHCWDHSRDIHEHAGIKS